MDISKLLDIAVPQDGCITRPQALQVVQRGQLEYLISARTLTRVHPRTYVVAGFPDSWRQRAFAATLSLSGSVLSFESAGQAWGIFDQRGRQIHVSASPHQASRRASVVVHRILHLAEFRTTTNGLPVTTPARTLVDLAEHIHPRQLEIALDRALNQSIVTLNEISHCLTFLAETGRARASALRRLLSARTTTDEGAESFLERKILRWIRDAKLPHPVAQHWVDVGPHHYRLDFAYPHWKLAVEVDGPHHLLPSNAASDHERDARLSTDGWLVLRVGHTGTADSFIPLLRRALESKQADDSTLTQLCK